MKESSTARRYAKAFTGTFAEPSELEEVGRDLRGFADAFEESRQLRTVLLHPAVSLEEKRGVMQGVLEKLGAGMNARKLMDHVLDKDRLALTPYIAEEYEKLSYEILGKVRVEVTSASSLSEEEVAELSGKLSAMAGKEAVVDVNVDPSLIGGIVAKIGSVVYDGSVKNQLRALRVGVE